MAKYNIIDSNEKIADYGLNMSMATIEQMRKQIIEILVIDRRYRDKDYSAKLLADEIGASKQYISAVFAVLFHMNYSAFVNMLRVNEAKTLLQLKRKDKVKMEDIGEAVGFANRQSFYAAFYKETGMSPRTYKEQFRGK